MLASKNDLLKVITTTYSKLLEISDKEKIQILAPIYKGICGINEINKTIQDLFNKNELLIEYGELIYKAEDRVMQLVNRPEIIYLMVI